MTTTAPTSTRRPRDLRVVDGVPLPAPGTYVLDPFHTRIGFIARHLMVTKVRGNFGEFDGSITIAEDPAQSTAQATHQGAQHRDRCPRP